MDELMRFAMSMSPFELLGSVILTVAGVLAVISALTGK
jgi:hypothetical protein